MSDSTNCVPQLAESVRLTCRVSSGLDGATRIMLMLRSRHYRVATLSVDTRGLGAGLSLLSCDLTLEPGDVPMLLARLERMPVVISSDVAVQRSLECRF